MCFEVNFQKNPVLEQTCINFQFYSNHFLAVNINVYNILPGSSKGNFFSNAACKFRKTSITYLSLYWVLLSVPDETLALVQEILLDNTPESFQSFLDEVLESVSSNGKTVYIMVDFNITLLNVETWKVDLEVHQKLLTFSTIESYSFFATIDKPTRVYNNSATLIDNIFANNVCWKITNGYIISDSDHYSQFCIVESSYQKIIQRAYDAKFLSILEGELRINVVKATKC